MHVRLTTINTSKQHEKFIKELSQKQYLVEGPLRKGYAKASVAEIRNWDIRLKKEAVPELLRNVGAIDLADDKFFASGSNPDHHVPKFPRTVAKIILKLFRKITKHEVPNYYMDYGDRNPNMIPSNGWQYSFVWGCYRDPEREDGNEEL